MFDITSETIRQISLAESSPANRNEHRNEPFSF